VIDPDKALSLIEELAMLLDAVALPLAEARGCVLAETVRADRDCPPFDRAMMDGVAVRVADAGRKVTCCGEIAAGQVPEGVLTEGTCMTVMTGAACPEGTEAVVPMEEIVQEGSLVRLPEIIKPGAHRVPRGSECARGAVALEQGALITPLAAASLASLGKSKVQVIPKPGLALIVTGTEVVAEGQTPENHQIRDSNGPMLEAQAALLGANLGLRIHADDQETSLAQALECASGADVVLLTGGVSVGKYDLVPAELERYDAEIVFHKVRQKPGKPLLFARKGAQLIFGLPGNPLAAHFCFDRYVAPAVKKMGGFQFRRARKEGSLAEEVKAKGDRTAFMLARAEEAEGRVKLFPRTGASMADMFTTLDADCYVRLPEGTKKFSRGELVSFTWLGDKGWMT
jgi:molybdopterin molybdotransferase